MINNDEIKKGDLCWFQSRDKSVDNDNNRADAIVYLAPFYSKVLLPDGRISYFGVTYVDKSKESVMTPEFNMCEKYVPGVLPFSLNSDKEKILKILGEMENE